MVRKVIFILLMSLLTIPAYAQDSVFVPDVTGLSVPQAAAILNLSGLDVGSQLAVEPQEGQPINTIVAMSTEAGSQVARGTAIDISVVLPPNLRLIYDDNDITIQNLSDGNANLNGLILRDVNGTASYSPAQIAGTIDPDDCVQIWSIARNEPKSVAGCDSTLWRSTRDTGVHFWTQSNGIQSFSVLDNGVERTVCPAAPPNSQDSPTTCDAYISGGGNASGADVAPFVYLAYNNNAIAFVNPTQDQWMVTNQTNLLNFNPNLPNPGASLIFGDPNLLREEFTIGVGDVTRLAPQQCIVLSIEQGGTLPENCFAIAERNYGADIAFWLADFVVQSSTIEDTEVTCPAATSEETIICIAPR